MIKLKDLINREYHGKDCVAFEYRLVDNDKPEYDRTRNLLSANFKRSVDDSSVWMLCVVLEPDGIRESNVYRLGYNLPKPNMDLVMVAAIGLTLFQNKIKEEIQQKMQLDFALGDVVKDM